MPANQGWMLTAPDGTAAKVSAFDWSLDTARFLHHWLLRVPKWQVPSATASPKWLSEHTSHDTVVALLEDDGRLRFGDHKGSVSYHRDFGVFADKPAKTQPEPQTPSDDDDEFDP
jgi:hypothetical protein